MRFHEGLNLHLTISTIELPSNDAIKYSGWLASYKYLIEPRHATHQT